MQLFNLWPIPLLIDKISINPSWVKKIKKENYYLFKDKSAYGSTDIHILDKYPDLKTSLELKINHYVYNILQVKKNVEFYITTSWINKHKKGHFGGSHIHNNSMLSGVVYLVTDPNSGNIVFEKTNQYHNCFTTTVVPEYTEKNLFNSASFEVVVEPGMIALFPSVLQHYIQRSNSDKDRYSIAFNIFAKGLFGDAMNEVNLK